MRIFDGEAIVQAFIKSKEGKELSDLGEAQGYPTLDAQIYYSEMYKGIVVDITAIPKEYGEEAYVARKIAVDVRDVTAKFSAAIKDMTDYLLSL